MSGFWSTETMKSRLPDLLWPYDETQIANCSYEMLVGPQVFITGSGSDVRRELEEAEQITIPPGQFAQLLTEERIEMPPDSLGLISMKSRLKLRGLVNVSGFHIDPGFRGRLLFSVYNAGPSSVVLTRGQPAFLVWFATLDQTTEDVYDGKRNELVEISAEDVMQLHGDVYSPQALADRVASTHKEIEEVLSTTERGLSDAVRQSHSELEGRIRSLERRLSIRWSLLIAVIGAVAGVGLTLLVGALADDSTDEDPNQDQTPVTVTSPASEE